MSMVSIIIPTYNRASLLKEAIQSVLDQTYSDYEVIVVDDGSTDNTREIVNELSRQSSKVRYYYQVNRGRSAARNQGISMAKGEYVAFLDADDRFLPGKLHTQVRVLDDNPEYGMTYSYSLAVNEQGNILREDSNAAPTKLSGWIYPELLFTKGTIIKTPTVMVRINILREVGGFNESMHICEDLDLWRRIAKQYRVLQIEEPLSVVRYRNDEKPPLMQWVQARTTYYQKAIAEDPGIRKAIQSRLFCEMYYKYAIASIENDDIGLGIHLLGQLARTNPLLFPFKSTAYFFHLALYKMSRFLAGHLAPATYDRIRRNYWKIHKTLKRSK